MTEMARIVEPGGSCLVYVPNHFPIIGRVKLLITNSIDPFGYFPDAKRWEVPHIRFFDKESLIDLGEEVGLSMVRDLSWHFIRPARLARYLPRLSRALVNGYSDALSEGITILFKKV